MTKPYLSPQRVVKPACIPLPNLHGVNTGAQILCRLITL